MMLSLLKFFLCVVMASGFAPTTKRAHSPSRILMTDGGFSNNNNFNPLNDIGDMFSSMDDVIDDFFNKRMGNGEIFYGKRKFKPSGKVAGQYNGMGLTDKQRIEEKRELKELRMEQRRIAEERKKYL